MTKRTRIIKRIAALTLCVVLLSATALPVAYAEIITLPDGSTYDTSSGTMTMPDGTVADKEDVDMLIREVDRLGKTYGAIGAIELAIASGAYAGQELTYLTQTGAELKLITGGAAAAGLTPGWVAAMYDALLVGGILIAPFLDWGAIIQSIARGEGYDEYLFTSGNWFYDEVVNYTWLDNFSMWFIDKVDPGYEYDKNDPFAKQNRYMELTKKGWEQINDWLNNTYGNDYGTQILPSIEGSEYLDMIGAEYMGKGWLGSDRWFVPGPMTVAEPVFGQKVYMTSGGYFVSYYIENINTGLVSHGFNPNVFKFEGLSVMIHNDEKWISDRMIYQGLTSEHIVSVIPDNRSGGNQTGTGNIVVRPQDIGLPSIEYTNLINEIKDILDLIEDDETTVELPTPDIEPSGNPYIDYFNWMELMRQLDIIKALLEALQKVPGPDPEPNPDPDPEPEPETEPEPSPSPSPKPEEEPRSSFLFFPFSIPFDIIDMIKSLDDTPEAPKWEIPFKMEGVFDEKIVIDLSVLEPIMPFVRILILAVFVVGLMKATSSFIKW